jgi:hypothetical protein
MGFMVNHYVPKYELPYSSQWNEHRVNLVPLLGYLLSLPKKNPSISIRVIVEAYFTLPTLQDRLRD